MNVQQLPEHVQELPEHVGWCGWQESNFLNTWGYFLNTWGWCGWQELSFLNVQKLPEHMISLSL